MKNYWGSTGDLQSLSGLDEKTSEVIDLDKPDWKYVRTLPAQIQKKIREEWEKNNPHEDANVYTEWYVKAMESGAKEMIEAHAERWKVDDKTIQIQWDNTWKTHQFRYSKEEKERLLNEFIEVAFNEGYFPEPIDNPNGTEEMTDKQILVEKMELTEKQAEYVLMLKEAKQHLKKLERIRSEQNLHP